MRFPPLQSNALLNSVVGFLTAGGLATLSHWVTMFCLIQTGHDPLIATVLGSLLGAAVNYLAQRSLAFRSAGPHLSVLWKYATSCVFAFALNAAVFWILTRLFETPVLTSQVVTTAVVAVTNYVVYKRLVFHEHTA